MTGLLVCEVVAKFLVIPFSYYLYKLTLIIKNCIINFLDHILVMSQSKSKVKTKCCLPKLKILFSRSFPQDFITCFFFLIYKFRVFFRAVLQLKI